MEICGMPALLLNGESKTTFSSPSVTGKQNAGKEYMYMGYRCAMAKENNGDSEFRLMEVVMVKKSQSGETASSRVLIIDNDQETLRQVQENWNDFIGNMIKVKKMEERDRQKVTESSEI